MDATEHATPISIPSAGALDKFLSNVANRKFDGWKDSSILVRAWGSLRQLDDKLKTAEGNGWPKVYAFQLESEGAIVMDAPRSLLSGYRSLGITSQPALDSAAKWVRLNSGPRRIPERRPACVPRNARSK